MYCTVPLAYLQKTNKLYQNVFNFIKKEYVSTLITSFTQKYFIIKEDALLTCI